MNYCNVANTILSQLGGKRFIAMTGAKHLSAFGELDSKRKWPGLHFHLPLGEAKYVRIALSPDDTYTIQFFDRQAGKLQAEVSDVYVDSLRGTIEKYTGLAMSL